jgi:predicted RNA-binding Zn-ribbon protein involved in translation (DUF1610 family)
MAGESQADLIGMDVEEEAIDAEVSDANPETPLKHFESSIPKNTDMSTLTAFLEQTAARNKATVDEVKIEAVKDLRGFWKFFGAWEKQQKAKEADKKAAAGETIPRFECPKGGFVTLLVCEKCHNKEGADGQACGEYMKQAEAK